MAHVLVAAAIAWPLVLGAALWHRVQPPDGTRSLWTSGVYLAASVVCHQQPERSFHAHDVAWPVCARCSGLYLAAPLAVVMAFRRRTRRPEVPGLSLRLLAIAAVPTVLTLLWEWGGAGTPSNLWRFTTALPLGAAIALVLVQVAQWPRTNQIH